ncbi:MAG TPA: molybdopterin cofactor-binding domain-containing protein [Caulobacter sp.]|nr:molybdopterin cofactor-binding domain-containing protein [Caulobacter sp.]
MNAPVDRRAFLAASGAFTLSFAAPQAVRGQQPAAQSSPWTAYLAIAADGKVHLLSPTTEMGQGTHTAHAAIIADEIGVPLEWVTVDTPMPSDPFRRGGQMGSGGSAGVRAWWEPLRKVGASARQSLINAAATKAGVPAAEVSIENGKVLRGGKPLMPLGEAARLAAAAPPVEGTPKDPKSYRIVGKTTPRVDIPAKVRGEPIFSSDFTRPGMVYACAVLAPVWTAQVGGLSEGACLAVKGVERVVPFPGGAAVIGKTQWAAMKGAAALEVSWASTPHDGLTSEAISAAMLAGLDRDAEAINAKTEGDFAATAAGAAQVVEADYEVPYIAHTPMEPWSVTIEPTADGGLELWGPFQTQDRNRGTAAKAAGIPPEKVKLHTLMLGGGFGRRLGDDGIPAAVATALAVKKPVKFFWKREDEIGQGWYRPAQVARLKCALDKDGKVVGLSIRTAGPSMRDSFQPGGLAKGLLDFSSVQILTDFLYKPGAYKLDWVRVDQVIPMAPWRAVGATQNGYFLEAFLDEVAKAARKDPVQLRRELLAGNPRALKVIDTAADAGDWGKPLKKGRARGFAFVYSFASLCAHVVEASIENGEVKLHKVTCVIDCARVVTPDGARSQMEGGIVQGLSTALFEGIEIAGGACQNRNFDGYRMMRINEAPVKIETIFIENDEPVLGGIGEPGLPPATPALVNALVQLTGKPIRKLPIMAQLQAPKAS